MVDFGKMDKVKKKSKTKNSRTMLGNRKKNSKKKLKKTSSKKPTKGKNSVKKFSQTKQREKKRIASHVQAKLDEIKLSETVMPNDERKDGEGPLSRLLNHPVFNEENLSVQTDIPSEKKIIPQDQEELGEEEESVSELENETLIPREYLAFYLSGEEYAVDIMMIKEIIKPVVITHVPRAPDVISGIISLRGTILPILNLRKKLGLKDLELGRQARIVVVSSEKGLVGLMVDAVTGVIKLSDSEIEPPPSVLNEIEVEFVKGVGRYKERFIVFMDVNKVLFWNSLLSEREVSV